MPSAESIIEIIRDAFAAVEYPGDGFLAGSTEGCEPEDEVGPFRGRTDWRELDAEFLDERAGALNFFSEAALRFFLPAYLIADIEGELEQADPLFTLTHGFHDRVISIPAGGRTFKVRSGKSAFVNPRRFGAKTFGDHARSRLSIFAREEAAAIVEYLKWRRSRDTDGMETADIEAALDGFWRERAHTAPTQGELQDHLDEQAAYLDVISRGEE